MKTRLFLILGMVALLSPVLALAQSSCPNPVVIQPSGAVVGTNFDFVAPASSNFYQFDVKPNRSYAVTVRQNYDQVNNDLTGGGGGGVTIFTDVACTSALAGANDTSASEPPLPANAFRVGFITGNTVANPSYRIKVQNGNGSVGRYIEVIVSETTKFSPLYTTFSGYNTFYRVFNTTSASISGKISTFDGAGNPIGTPVNVTIPAYSVSATIFTGAGAGQLNIAANNAGPAVWVDNGPPGGTLIDGFSWNGNSTFPIKFVSVRE